ncbi:ATP-grasp domain-containing protein [Streptomyces sp. NPDC046727]|uniref:ATP-grasp domain-containing protein n=1 Tax=Streptomyces sp. NPDC046727 TaxID=3155373 RepID=UPI0033E3A1EF
MSSERDVLVFSKRFAGGVDVIAEILKGMNRRPVLVSEIPGDVNAESCADHVVVDWGGDFEQFTAAIEAAGVAPTAVVNLVEPLIEWQVRAARHYGVPGGEPGRETLLSKASVRAKMRRLRLSDIEYTAGPVASVASEFIEEYPVIVKPARDSGGSRLVRKATDPAQLSARLREIAEISCSEFEVVVEQYLDGVEFSVDGPVVDGSFRGLFVVEKTEHDERRHHDAGLRISPPPSDHVRRGATELAEKISTLCADLQISAGWLHVEGRVRPNGRAELVEINPRPGGGLHRSAITRTCGVDPFRILVLMALGEPYLHELEGAARNDELLALLPFEADQVGTLAHATPIDVIKRLPGVVDGYQFTSFWVTSMEQENFFTEALITADTVEDLSTVAKNVIAAFEFKFE